MSVLKVGALRSPSASSNNIVLNSDGTITTGDGGTFVSNNYYEAFKLTAPTITSIHPSSNVGIGDTVYIVGTGFDATANLILTSNTNYDIIVPRGNITVNNSANITFVVPDNFLYDALRENFDVSLNIRSTGLSAYSADALDAPNSPSNQGFNRGYSIGGDIPGNPSPDDNMEKFPFATDSNATDIGDLAARTYEHAGQSSSVAGYTTGSRGPGETSNIRKFLFANETNQNLVGSLTVGRYQSSGQYSSVSGYTYGGFSDGTTIDKFPFATDSDATDVGDSSNGFRFAIGQSSLTNGYSSGGITQPNPGATFYTIDKFPFSTDSNATDIGDLTTPNRYSGGGQQSSVSGYTSGGYQPPTLHNVIDKFPFATDSNATDVGDLTVARYAATGQSSGESGYTTGGLPAPTNSTVIDKFPFSTDSNATDVGDLVTVNNGQSSGHQI